MKKEDNSFCFLRSKDGLSSTMTSKDDSFSSGRSEKESNSIMVSEDGSSYSLRSRNRSRSETPQVSGHSIDDDYEEQNYNLRSKRSKTPAGTRSSEKSYTRNTRSMSSASRRSKVDMDDIEESEENTLNNNIEIKRSDPILKVTVKKLRSPEFQKYNTSKNLNNEKINRADFNLDDQSVKNNNTSKKLFHSDLPTGENDKNDCKTPEPISGYEFYKKQGDWWNKFPKTDYTYSPASTCRYEVAPGIMAKPNMSRRSLRSEDGSFNSSQDNFDKVCGNSSLDSANSEFSETMKVPSSLSEIGNTSSLDYIDAKSLHESGSSIVKDDPYQRVINPNQFFIFLENNNLFSPQNLEFEINGIFKHNGTCSISFSNILSMLMNVFIYISTCGYYPEKRYTKLHSSIKKGSKWNYFMLFINGMTNAIYLMTSNVLLLDRWLLSRFTRIRGKLIDPLYKIYWILFPIIFTTVCFFMMHVYSTLILNDSNQKVIRNPILFQKDLIKPILENPSQEFEDLKNKLLEHTVLLNGITQEIKYLKSEFGSKNDKIENIKLKYENVTEKIFNLNKQIQELELKENSVRKIEELLPNYFGLDFSKEDIVRTIKKIQVLNIDDFSTKNETYYNKNELPKNEMKKIIRQIVKDEIEETIDKKLKVYDEEIEEQVDKKLKFYDADRTGKADFALESAGGQIISTRNTPNYIDNSRVTKLFGFTIFSEKNDPRTIIQGKPLQPGICWAFADFPGIVLIKLRSLIHVTGFTVEHAHKENLPEGLMKSAPKKFSVWGFQFPDDKYPILLGDYEFTDLSNLQFFPVNNTPVAPFEYVELRIFSNHGRKEYTCLYRFRVHGRLVKNA